MTMRTSSEHDPQTPESRHPHISQSRAKRPPCVSSRRIALQVPGGNPNGILHSQFGLSRLLTCYIGSNALRQ